MREYNEGFLTRGGLQNSWVNDGEAPRYAYKNIETGSWEQFLANGTQLLRELKTIYSLEDAFKLWEVIVVNHANEKYLMDKAQKGGKNQIIGVKPCQF